MSRRFDDDGLLDPFGDELDLAETVARENPTADQLQHFANLRGAKHAMLNREAKFVRNNPPSVLKGTLGNQVALIANQRQQVAAWTGDDAETTPVTVTIASVEAQPYQTDNPGADYAPQRPYAILQFGTRSSLVTAEIDVGVGCQFTIGASMVTLQMALAIGPVANPTVPQVPRVLAGMLSFHPIVRTQDITRTIYCIDDVASASAINYDIPAFAKSLKIIRANNGLLAGLLRFFDTNDQTICEISLLANTQDFQSYPVPANAASFRVNYTVSGAQYPVVAQFQLAL